MAAPAKLPAMSAEAIEALLKVEFPQAFFDGSGLSIE
jgi:hypothetical protein